MLARFYPTPSRQRRQGILLGVLALLALLLSRPLAGQPPAVHAQAQGTHTFTTCVAHGPPPIITVPAYASVDLAVYGGAGHHGSDIGAGGGDGGNGALVQATLLPTHEERQITIYVGCAGRPAADSPGGLGYTNGGVGGFAHHAAGSGAGGGGSSAVLLEGIGPLLVAGGGGGGGGGGEVVIPPPGAGAGGAKAGKGGPGGDAGGTPGPEPGGAGGEGDTGGAGGCGGCVGGDAGGHGAGTDNNAGGGGGGGGGYCVPGPSCTGANNGGGGHGGSVDDDAHGGGGGGGAGNSYVYAAPWLINTSVGTNSVTVDGQITITFTPSAPGWAAPGPAAPAQPMTVRGQVHYVIPPLVSENQIASTVIPHTRATVEALVGGTVCGTAVTDAAGRFALTVAAHPATPGCGQPGATVRFRIDGSEYPKTVPFQSGGTAAVALRLPHQSAPLLPGWP